jgi:hypothetical protein
MTSNAGLGRLSQRVNFRCHNGLFIEHWFNQVTTAGGDYRAASRSVPVTGSVFTHGKICRNPVRGHYFSGNDNKTGILMCQVPGGGIDHRVEECVPRPGGSVNLDILATQGDSRRRHLVFKTV